MHIAVYLMLLVVFFFKQKTAYEMRISDWSSDVCSSDLHFHRRAMRRREEHRVTGAQSGRVRRAETKVAITAQLWKQGVGTTPIFLARGQYGDLCVRVLCEQQIGRAHV